MPVLCADPADPQTPQPCSVPGSTLLLETLYIQMEFCDGTTLREAIVSGELQKDEALIWKLTHPDGGTSLGMMMAGGMGNGDGKEEILMVVRMETNGKMKMRDNVTRTAPMAIEVLEMLKEAAVRAASRPEQEKNMSRVLVESQKG
ncbi:unnamed protein product [Cladocopium goreaui]|uniref:Non-specific serine/threonine protein kinase n=1 Tax=Cladocopium goreaui TaxID=2562237 RepID=A0A9P1DLR5_9DINO|nr:unnamed protein product [Cladocopium goreaui]